MIDKWKRIDFKDVYNKYVERGRKRLQNPGLVKRMSTTDDALFTTGKHTYNVIYYFAW